jgi:hypothetical protein
MDTSELFAVEYNRDKREWRVDTLDKVLEANYKHFLGKHVLRPPSLGVDWILLGVCASLEEANALANKFKEIKDKFDRDMEEAGFPSSKSS